MAVVGVEVGYHYIGVLGIPLGATGDAEFGKAGFRRLDFGISGDCKVIYGVIYGFSVQFSLLLSEVRTSYQIKQRKLLSTDSGFILGRDSRILWTLFLLYAYFSL